MKYKTRINMPNDPHNSAHYSGQTMELVKEFRAQRNFYISGTALFLWLYVFKFFIFNLKNKLSLMMTSKRFEAS